MKKILLISGAIVLLAAACNNQVAVGPAQNENKVIETSSIANSRRRADLGQVEVMLSLYHDKYGKYPLAVGNTPEQRWQNLSDTIVTKEDLAKGLISRPLTQDPRQKETGYSYDYKNSPAQDNYIVKAILESSDKDISGDFLKNDLDGVIYGIDCNDPSYCVTFQSANNQTSQNQQPNSADQSASLAAEANARRVADVASIRVTVELYFNDHGTYPAVAGNKNTERWLALGGLVIPTYISHMPEGAGASYDYIVSPDHKGYVLKTVLDMNDPNVGKYYNSNNPSRLNGTVYATDCNKPAYCIGVVTK